MSARKLSRFRGWELAALLLPVALLAAGCGDGPDSKLVAQLRPKLLLQQEPDQVVQVSELREQFAPGGEFSASIPASDDESQQSETASSAQSDESADGGPDLAAQPREVALLGVVGGVTNPFKESRPEFPFAEGEALFYLADVGVVAEAEADGHQHAPGEECAFCAAHAEDNSKLLAVVQFRDENGKLWQVDARDLFDLKEGETVVVRGVASLGAGDTILVDAEGLYVRR